jgi:hypothetical protein
VRGDQIAVTRPVQPLQIANRGGTVAAAAERRKVVQPQQISRHSRHRIYIQGARPGGDVARLLRSHPVGRRRQPIPVVTPQGRESGVETHWRAGDTENPDIGGQQPAETSQ